MNNQQSATKQISYISECVGCLLTKTQGYIQLLKDWKTGKSCELRDENSGILIGRVTITPLLVEVEIRLATGLIYYSSRSRA